jgi:SP family sugar:H+ symporter-like MFS transporter
MGFFRRKKAQLAESVVEKSTPAETPSTLTPANSSDTSLPVQADQNDNVAADEALKKQPVTLLATMLGGIASIGGFMFGYESGQISGISQYPHPTYSRLTNSRFPPDV